MTKAIRPFSSGEQFPLGDPCQSPAQDAPEPADVDVASPFGLRFATPIRAANKVDLRAVEFDHARQISVIARDGVTIPLTELEMPITLEATGVPGPSYDEIQDKT